MTDEEINKLVLPIQALKLLRRDMSLRERYVIYPGIDAIITDADKVLENNPNMIPDWYKPRLNKE